MRQKELLIFRTHTYTEYNFNLLKQLEKYFSILVIADTRKNKFCYTGFNQIEFSKANIDRLGLQYFDDMQWRCGDYAYYLALNEVKIFNYAWMIEPDIVFNFENVINFFENFRDDSSDLLITHFKEADENWYWYKYKYVFGKDVKIYQSLFSLTRVSFNAINILYNNRKNIKEPLNDEIFVTTTLKNNNLIVNDINHKNIFYTRMTFSYNYPIYFKNIKNNNNMIYHPVFFNLSEFKKNVAEKCGWISFCLIKIHLFDFLREIKHLFKALFSVHKH